MLKDSVQCVIKGVVIKNQRNSLGTNTVFFIAATVELVSHATNRIGIERDSLVVALYTVRLSDTNGAAWKIRSPLDQYHYHPVDTGQRDFITLRVNFTNRLEVMLTSLDAPFVLINEELITSNQTHQIPTRMFGSIFTTVLGRVDGQQKAGKILIQGASNFGIKYETPSR